MDEAQPEPTRLSPGETFKLVEERRKAFEGVLWQLPSVSIAAQAFLLNAGLSRQATNWTRVLVGLLGILVVVATGVVVAFQSVRMSLLYRWVANREHGLDEKVIVAALAEDKKIGKGLTTAQELGLRYLPTPLWMWALALCGFFVADVIVFVNGV